MRDPHVERLHYAISSGEGIAYDNPEPLTFTNTLGSFDARDGRLTVTPADHFPDEDDARAVIEHFLRGWEIESDLDHDIGTLRFKFLSSDVIDRDPPPPGSSIVLVGVAATARISSVAATLLITWRRYPSAPANFQTTIDVERAYRRWLDFRAGREPLQAMAYFVLTLIQATAGGNRRAAAKRLNVEHKILHKIAELSSTKGDEATARKVAKDGAFQPLTGTEKAWLEQAIRMVIKRLGEHQAGGDLKAITMTDLPNL